MKGVDVRLAGKIASTSISSFVGLVALLVSAAAVLASSILPEGSQQFVDANGQPLVGGSVCLYVVGTTTPKLSWQDRAQSTPNATPCLTLDSAGRAVIWGYGQYREQVFDQFGNLIWDKPVSEYVSDVQNNLFNWGGQSTTAVANTYAIAVVPVPPSYVAGQEFEFVINAANSGPATLNVGSLGPKAMDKVGLAGPIALAGGELKAGNIVLVEYDGAEFQIISVTPTNPSGFACNDSSGIAFWNNCNQTFTLSQRGGQSGGSITPTLDTFTLDFNSGQHFPLLLDHVNCPCTVANPTNISGAVGQVGLLVVQQSSSGSDTIGTWGTDWKFPSGTAPTLSTGANAIDIFPYYVFSTTDILLGTGGLNYAP